MVREPLAAHPGSGGVAARPGSVHRVLGAVAKPLHRFAVMSLIHSPPALAGPAGAGSLNGGPPDRRRLVGRLAALFFAGAGVLGLVTLPLPAPGLDLAATAAVNAVALTLGIAIWFAPWDRWPRRASLALVPPAFALIAMGNVFSGADLYTYGVFFVVAFVVGRPGPSATHVGRPGAAGGRRLRFAAVLPARHPGVRADLGGDHHPGVCTGRGGNRVGRGQAGADRAGPGAGTGPGRAASRTR